MVIWAPERGRGGLEKSDVVLTGGFVFMRLVVRLHRRNTKMLDLKS